MLFLAFALVLVPSTGSAASVNGWTSHTGLDYELMMGSSNEVGAYELVQLINYDVHDLRLELWQVNGTMIMSQTVGPHSSAFVQLDYGTTDCRIDIVSSYYGLEGSYTRIHVYELLPPPVDNGGWIIKPPTVKDPDLIYSQEDLDRMLSWFTVENVGTAVLVMSAGAIVGAGVKHTTRFLKPYDVLSMAFMAALASDYVLHYLGEFDRIWYAPLVIGYLIGFVLWHVDYILPVRTDCKERTLDVRPVVVYTPDAGSGWCVQTQNNKELMKRLFLGIEHRLTTDTGLNQDWTGMFKGPRGRRIRGRVLWIQKSEVKESDVKVSAFRCKQYATIFKLSHASGVEKSQWLNDVKWYFRIQDKFDRLSLKYSDLLLGHRTEANRMGAAMVEHSTGVNPAHRVEQFFGNDSGPVDLEVGENVLTVIEEADTGADVIRDNDSCREAVEHERTKTKNDDEDETED